MRVVFLGTSSATPTPQRFLPSVALMRQGDIFLLDCGEGSQIRFRRAGLRFSRLRWLLVSHMHGDHITGLLGLLMSLQMAERTAPLEIAGPVGLQDYILTNRRLLRTEFGYELRFTELTEPFEVVYDGPDFRLEAARLDHRLSTYGYALAEKPLPGRFQAEVAAELGVPFGPLCGRLQRGEAVTLDDGRVVLPEQVLGPSRPGRRVAYVTDTRPCPGGVLLAESADLLIHEATFGADLADEARVKKHSTTREAAEVARLAGARHLVLTHFSPRYVDLEALRAEAAELFEPVDVAWDLREFVLEPVP